MMAVPSCGERGEELPAAVERDEDQADVEDGDVSEEAKRVVLAGREQNGREKTTEHAEDGDDEGVEAHGDKKRRGGDERHEQERRDRPEEFKVVDRSARERDGVKRDDARGAQGMRERGKFLRDSSTPPTSRPRPVRKPAATRSSGRTRLLSNEYLMKKATQRKRVNPPSQAKPLTPMNCSQLTSGAMERGGDRGLARGEVTVGSEGQAVSGIGLTGGGMTCVEAATCKGTGAPGSTCGSTCGSTGGAICGSAAGVGKAPFFSPNRPKTSRSTSPRRRVSSSMRFLASAV